MNNVSALGFYAKHLLIMDELYWNHDYDTLMESLEKVEGLPLELIALAKDNVDLISELLVNIDKELELFQSLYKDLRERIKIGAIIKRGQGFEWDYKVEAKTKDGRMTLAKTLEFGWDWNIQNEVLYLDSWAWISGGRSSEHFLLYKLRKMAPKIKNELKAAIEIDDFKWSSGAVRLNRINVSELVNDDFNLDLIQLRDDLWKSFSWINEIKLLELFTHSSKL